MAMIRSLEVFLFCSFNMKMRNMNKIEYWSVITCLQALKSFSRAVHINPANTELRNDDLMWAAELVHRKASLEREKLSASSAAAACSDGITVLAADGDVVGADDQLTTQHRNSCSSLDEPFDVELQKLPPDYVAMRLSSQNL